MLRALALLLALCAPLGAIAQPQAQRPARPPRPPALSAEEYQGTFTDMIATGQAEFADAINDLVRFAALVRRDAAVCHLVITHGSPTRWTGTIVALSAATNGAGILSVRIAPGVTFSTGMNPAVGTLIPPASPVYTAALALRIGERVRFSGSMMRDSREPCRLGEFSASANQSLAAPTFLFRFERLERLD